MLSCPRLVDNSHRVPCTHDKNYEFRHITSTKARHVFETWTRCPELRMSNLEIEILTTSLNHSKAVAERNFVDYGVNYAEYDRIITEAKRKWTKGFFNRIGLGLGMNQPINYARSLLDRREWPKFKEFLLPNEMEDLHQRGDKVQANCLRGKLFERYKDDEIQRYIALKAEQNFETEFSKARTTDAALGIFRKLEVGKLKGKSCENIMQQKKF